MGVTIFKFQYPDSSEHFTKSVIKWLTSTKEGNRYIIRDSEEGMLLKIQRGKGVMTAPIILEFKVGAALGIPTEIQARGYVHVFGLKKIKQDLRSDAKITAIPRRNGWKDMQRILNHANIPTYDHEFQS